MDLVRFYQNRSDPQKGLSEEDYLYFPYTYSQSVILNPYIEIQNPTPGLYLSPEQNVVRDDIISWIVNPTSKKRYFVVGGFAGTGKTTLIRHIQAYLESIHLSYAVSALMGLTVSVLLSKGVSCAQTLHSCLYHVDEEARREGVLRFILNSKLPYSLLIIDEGSTLSETHLNNLLSFQGVRVLIIGDHGQLKPIDSGRMCPMSRPDCFLTEVHRQALDSNILKFAHLVRNNKVPTYGSCHDVSVRPRDNFMESLREYWKYDQIIVGFNRTRHEVNRQVRRYRGYDSEKPCPGDRVICLVTQPDLGIYNGQIFVVQDVGEVYKGKFIPDYVRLRLVDDIGRVCEVKALLNQFGQNKIYGETTLFDVIVSKNNLSYFDYAFAVSCHKAIGSQWSSVKLLEEYHPKWEFPRFAYTGATRAVSYLDYYR